MNEDDIRTLSHATGTKVRITAVGGEVFLAKVLWIERERHELVHELISTTIPERYKAMGRRSDGLWVIPFDYIDRVDKVETLD